MSNNNCASLEATMRYRERFNDTLAAGHFRRQQDLWLSSIGVGTYLGNADDETDRRYTTAIARAVQLGANVIDTAANYRFQRSERAIGKALAQLAAQGFARDEIVICTKGGYLPFDGAPPRDLRRYVEDTFVKPGIASFEDIVGGSHCMTPAYLRNQLEQSLRNMALDCVDVYYIHNPESQVGSVTEKEFYFRLRAAFAALEQARTNGQLKFYGVATWNGFRVPMGGSGYHSLERMITLAREVGGDAHGFRFIQLPFNLAMPEALTLANQTLADQQVPTLEAAAGLGVTVMSSASIFQGRVARGLPEDLRESLGSLPTDAQAAIQFVRSAPGVCTALVGMSGREHVEENLKLARTEPLRLEDFMQLFAEG
ncbi:MAG TPA: aldo/keto reductase [Pyrinomonadaceae bacterium]|jgi:aryl-alcohol dehydrogenase-like predicted oxidoreductase